jgi:hypothetical protein
MASNIIGYMTLLQAALDKNKYDLAAHILVLGLLKTKQDDAQREKKKQKARILQPRTG